MWILSGKVRKTMEKGTVKRRIFISNALMVLVTLVLFLGINIFVIFCYSESVENEVKAKIEEVVDPDKIDDMLKDYTIYRNEFILLFGVDGVLCIAALIIMSQVFTRNLTEHIMEPLDALSEGTKRIKENDLSQEISYSGEIEFEAVCTSFNEMMKSIAAEQEKNRKYEKARTDMIAGISHDLRTPLTAIKGTIKALMDGVVSKPEQQQKFLETAYRRTGDMDMLLNQLFYLSKIETGNMPLFIKDIDIGQFLQSYADGRMSYADTRSSHANDKADCEKINIDTGKLSEIVSADPEQLQRILDNLIENSRKYAQRDKLIIDITASKHADQLTVSVKDNGVGVPEDKLPHIFDEFYRVDESRNKKEGNGLGLYIVRYLMEAMGGSVEAKNADGLLVELHFPLKEQEV